MKLNLISYSNKSRENSQCTFVSLSNLCTYTLVGWLYWGLTSLLQLGHTMAVGDAYVFSGFLTPVLTQHFFPKPPTTFLTCFCRGERRKYAGKKSLLNPRSDTLTTEPPGLVCTYT